MSISVSLFVSGRGLGMSLHCELFAVCHGWSTFDYIVQEREGNEQLTVEEGNGGRREPSVKWRHVSTRTVDIDGSLGCCVV